MKKEIKQELLEVIAQQAGCSYLSDLILQSYQTAVRSAIQELEVEEYSLSEWQETVRYLLNDDTICVSSSDKAKALLLQRYDN